ncbi:MAG TPA: sulfotransferase, partial [Xanthomonadaceae bacterium]|nr:sulfotransferase [Xanthomonadaceae bacterium]
IVVANLLAREAQEAAAPARPRPPQRPGFGGMNVQFSFGSAPPRPATRAAPVPATRSQGAARFERPVILLSAPRSGSTLLFETLSQAPGLLTIGHESHRTIEGLPGLHPAARGYGSNRLTAEDASDEIAEALRSAFAGALRDRDGRPPLPGRPVRLLEKTPKNILRVPFLRRVFPDALFVYLYREPRPVLASMIEAWQSGRFRTYAELPGWVGPPWSLLLVPGWRDLIGRPLEEIVARQWAAATAVLLDDVASLPREAVVTVRYDDLVARPDAEARRLCAAAGLDWDRPLARLPLSRHTLTPPDPDKWRRHEAEINRVLPVVEEVRRRAEAFVAG